MSRSLILLAASALLIGQYTIAAAQDTGGLRPGLDPEDAALGTSFERTRAIVLDGEDDPAAGDEAFGAPENIVRTRQFRPPGGLVRTDTAVPNQFGPPEPPFDPFAPDQALAANQPQATLRQDDPFAPLGIKSGGLIYFPGIEVTGTYTDNVEEIRSGGSDDFGIRVAPSLRVDSDWLRHQLRVSAAGDFVMFADNPDFDEKSAAVDIDLRLDVRRFTQLDVAVRYTLDENSGAETEVPDTASQRRQDHDVSVVGALTHDFGSVVATGRAGARYRIFSNVDLAGGGQESNSDRNYVEPVAGFRITHRARAQLRPFVGAAYEPRFHETSRDRFGTERDSQGASVEVGFETNVADLWSGEVAVVYLLRDFDDPSLKTIHSAGLRGDITWRPDRLTAVTFSADADIDESVRAAISGSRQFSASVETVHRLRDQLTLRTRAGVEVEEFVGSSVEDVTAAGDVSLSYFLRRGIEVIGAYRFEHLDSGTPGNGYTENRVEVGLRYRI